MIKILKLLHNKIFKYKTGNIIKSKLKKKNINVDDEKENDEFINFSNDIGIKRTLSDSKFLAQFLSLLKHKKISPEDITYYNIEYFTYENKKNIIRFACRLKVLNDKNILIHLEMQNQYISTLDFRMYNYMSNVISFKIKTGHTNIDFVYEAYWIMPQEAAHYYKVGNSFIYPYGIIQYDQYHYRLPFKINVVNLQDMSSCGILELEDISRLFLTKSIEDLSQMKTQIGKEWSEQFMILNQNFKKYYSKFLTKEDER